MRADEYQQFCGLMTGVHDFYGKDLSEFALSVWWEAMRPYDLSAVRDALSRHVVDPDAGQFMPKPADVVRAIGGRTIDAAQMAWSKVDSAVRRVGSYASVVFDDPIIHRVISDMGGWILLAGKGDGDWPFVAKEFETRYRGYKMRGDRPEYPAVLIGISEAHNSNEGYRVDPPVLIGDRVKALRVQSGGAAGAIVNVVRIGAAQQQLAVAK